MLPCCYVCAVLFSVCARMCPCCDACGDREYELQRRVASCYMLHRSIIYARWISCVHDGIASTNASGVFTHACVSVCVLLDSVACGGGNHIHI